MNHGISNSTERHVQTNADVCPAARKTFSKPSMAIKGEKSPLDCAA
jgi:hypothetical protein